MAPKALCTLGQRPKNPSGKGRDAKKGQRLRGTQVWADDAMPCTTLVFDLFGLRATLLVKNHPGALSQGWKDRLFTIILVKDGLGKRPFQMFYCSRLDRDARTILSCYVGRWAIDARSRTANSYWACKIKRPKWKAR
jgi:hypothetical protein